MEWITVTTYSEPESYSNSLTNLAWLDHHLLYITQSPSRGPHITHQLDKYHFTDLLDHNPILGRDIYYLNGLRPENLLDHSWRSV